MDNKLDPNAQLDVSMCLGSNSAMHYGTIFHFHKYVLMKKKLYQDQWDYASLQWPVSEIIHKIII